MVTSHSNSEYHGSSSSFFATLEYDDQHNKVKCFCFIKLQKYVSCVAILMCDGEQLDFKINISYNLNSIFFSSH